MLGGGRGRGAIILAGDVEKYLNVEVSRNYVFPFGQKLRISFWPETTYFLLARNYVFPFGQLRFKVRGIMKPLAFHRLESPSLSSLCQQPHS